MSAKIRLDWRGDEVLEAVAAMSAAALGEIGLRIEAEAKRNLKPSAKVKRGRRYVYVPGGGRGVRTGTLRRSLHTAKPGYSWTGDDVEPGPATPARGGRRVEGQRQGLRVCVAVGSGLDYAIYLHQSETSEGRHYLTRAVEKVAPQAPDILRKYVEGRRG